MRAKDMKPDTEYATCDGQMAVTGKDGPVKANWYTYRERDPETRRLSEQKIMQGNPRTDGDPWGGCRVASANLTNVVGPGVLVTLYDTDGNGERVGDGVTTVVRPRDIPGTWSQYMVLHGQEVRERGLRKAAYEAAHAEQKRVEARLREKYPDAFDDSGSLRAPTPRVQAVFLHADESESRGQLNPGSPITGYRLDVRVDARGSMVEDLLR